jgi:acyl-CoA synthetase (AMP-forming)/AMP-acid ligase II
MTRFTAVSVPPLAQTLVSAVRDLAEVQPDARALARLVDGDARTATMTFAELDQAARAIAATLQDQTAAGDCAVVMYRPGAGPDAVAGFLGCLYAGVIAVPVTPPRHDKDTKRLRAIVADTGAHLVLTDAQTRDRLAPAMAGNSVLGWCRVVATDAIDLDSAKWWINAPIAPEEIAYLQYTLGPAGVPHRTTVTHGDLMASGDVDFTLSTLGRTGRRLALVA